MSELPVEGWLSFCWMYVSVTFCFCSFSFQWSLRGIHLLATVNRIAVNIAKQMFPRFCFPFLWTCTPKVLLLDPDSLIFKMFLCCFLCWGNRLDFSFDPFLPFSEDFHTIIAVPDAFPTSRKRKSPSSLSPTFWGHLDSHSHFRHFVSGNWVACTGEICPKLGSLPDTSHLCGQKVWAVSWCLLSSSVSEGLL